MVAPLVLAAGALAGAAAAPLTRRKYAPVTSPVLC